MGARLPSGAISCRVSRSPSITVSFLTTFAFSPSSIIVVIRIIGVTVSRNRPANASAIALQGLPDASAISAAAAI
jgi:hypothetical protein